MKVTVDANALFSAILKDSTTRKLWFNSELDLFAPGFLIIEFRSHEKELLTKFSGTEKDFGLLVEKIISEVKLVSDEELMPFMQAASTLTNDKKDLLYFACALKENTVIWSNDKGMKKQQRITVKTTSELTEEIGAL